jgi:hypothetical protein
MVNQFGHLAGGKSEKEPEKEESPELRGDQGQTNV